jgi:UDP-N-acetylglucosamine 2-epimerase (non-hydrolysing)
MTLKILSLVDTRSGLIKAKAIGDAIHRFNLVSLHSPIEHLLVHTGQFCDTRGFDLYFNDLTLPQPGLFLGVSAAAKPFEKTAIIADRLANVLTREQPSVVLVAGDVDSALDCALITKRMRLGSAGEGQHFAPVLAHIEAGRRSFDRGALPEVNRVVVDMLSDYLFVAEESAAGNLLQEGIAREKVHFVGSIVVDTLLSHRARLEDSSILDDLQLLNGSSIRPFALLALQHLSDPNGTDRLSGLQLAFSEIARQMPVVFPASPAVAKLIHEADLGDYFIDHFLDGPEPWDERVRIRIIPPLGYLDFVRLAGAAKVVLTDSHSVQAESRVLGVPCIALSGEACRPICAENGATVPLASNPKSVLEAFAKATEGAPSRPALPRGWDGHAARRIVNILWNDFESRGPRKCALKAKSAPSMSLAGG